MSNLCVIGAEPNRSSGRIRARGAVLPVRQLIQNYYKLQPATCRNVSGCLYVKYTVLIDSPCRAMDGRRVVRNALSGQWFRQSGRLSMNRDVVEVCL